jgi:hypothetical protein
MIFLLVYIRGLAYNTSIEGSDGFNVQIQTKHQYCESSYDPQRHQNHR